MFFIYLVYEELKIQEGDMREFVMSKCEEFIHKWDLLINTVTYYF